MKMNKKIMALALALSLGAAFVGCSSGNAGTGTDIEQPVPDVALSADEVYAKVVEGVEIPNLMEAEEQMVKDTYGIDTALVKDYVVMQPMMSGVITEIAVFQVADAANVEAIAAGANSRLEALKNGGAFYPSHVEIVEKGQVVTKGHYVLFVADENVDAIVANFNKIFE